MSNDIVKIKDEEMVTVPVRELQDLLWNCGLATAGMGKGEEYVGHQCRVLQSYLDGVTPEEEDEYEGFTLEEFSLDDPLIKEFANVVEFKRQS